MWSDNAGLPVGKGQKLTKAKILAHMEHGGDRSAAARSLIGTTRGEVPLIAMTSEGGSVTDILAPIEDQVFDATDTLRTVRQAARSRMVSPWGLLLDVLARVAAETPPEVTLPPIIGSKASLNFSGALVGGSSAGKSTTHDIGEELLPSGQYTRIGPGTGEGIMTTFMRWVPPDRKAGVEGHFVDADLMQALLFADEIAQIGAVQARNGQTFGPILRSMWSGASVSTTNADTTRRRSLSAHRYRLAIVAGVQPALSDILLSDQDAGTPQRWVWLPVEDPRCRMRPPSGRGASGSS